MTIHFPARTQLAGVTGSSSTLTSAGHGLVAGQRVFFISGTGFTGLTAGRVYFARDIATDTFGLAETEAGAAIAIGTSSLGVFAAAIEVWDGASTQVDGGDRLECAQAVQVRDLIRSSDADIKGRDNRRRRFPIQAPLKFASARLAQEYMLEHYDTLAGQGWLWFTLGTVGDSSTRVAPAVLETCTLRHPAAHVVIVDYVFSITAAPAA